LSNFTKVVKFAKNLLPVFVGREWRNVMPEDYFFFGELLGLLEAAV
jgi:hypothetical protein